MGASGAWAQDAELEAALIEITDQMAFDETDELPAFGNEAFERVFDEPEDVTVIHVLALWGRIKPNDSDPIPLVWDPTVGVAPGDGVRVRRELRFEEEDRVLPQEVRHEVDMQSRTGPHIDGAILQVAIRPAGTRPDVAPFLRFESGPVSLAIPGPALPGLNETRIVDDAGNGLRLVALPRWPGSPCPNGTEHGFWAQTHPDGGVFGGVVRAENGLPAGFVAGRFANTTEGRSVFEGKLIDREGHFRGIARGVLGQSTFHGRWAGREGAHGVEHGMLRAHASGRTGSFRGRWAEVCLEPSD